MDCQYITDKSGVPVSVIISISEWESIQKQLRHKSEKRSIKNIKNEIKLLTEKYKSVRPFKSISDPSAWQKGIRDEW